MRDNRKKYRIILTGVLMAVMFIALFAGRISASAAVSGQVTASTLFVRTGPSTEYPKVTVNGKVARASYDVKINDIIEINIGKTPLKVKVLKVVEVVGKDGASELYEVV